MPHTEYRLSIFLFVLLSSVLCTAQTNPIDNMKAGEWMAVANSHLESVKPSPSPPGNTGVRSVIETWCGAAFDTKRDRLIVWGGGHTDYAGNEIYVFDVNTLKWTRIWGPTPNNQIPSGGTNETYSDGNPSSRHTYSGLTYIPDPVDALWAQGGSVWNSGSTTDATWEFNFGTMTWTRKSNASNTTYGVVCAYDPVSQLVYHRGLYDFRSYDPGTDRWQNLANNGGGWWSDATSAAIDSKRHLMIFMSGGSVEVINLVSHSRSTRSTGGDNAIVQARAPGLAYDPVSDKIVAWSGESGNGLRAQDVYLLDTDTFTWSRAEPAASNTTIPTNVSARGGTYSRFQYIPSKNAFILVNSVSENVYIYKLSGVIVKNVPRPQNLRVKP